MWHATWLNFRKRWVSGAEDKDSTSERKRTLINPITLRSMRRRKLLSVLGIGTAAVAGCLGTSEDQQRDDNDSEIDASKFDSIEFEGTELVVTIEDGTDIQTVDAVINEERTMTFRFGEGVSRDSTGISHTLYETVEFIALDDEGERIDSVKKSFEPELVVVEMHRAEGQTIGADNEEAFGDDGFEFPETRQSDVAESWFEIEAVVENVGNSPVYIPEENQAVIVEGTLSQKDEEELDWNEGKAGDDSFVPVSPVPVAPGETKPIDVIGGELGFHAREMDWNDPDNDDQPGEGRLKAEGLCDDTTETVVVVIFDETGKRLEEELEVTYSGEVIYWKHSNWQGWQPYSAIASCETIEFE